MLPAEWQDLARAFHLDLYSRHPAGFAHLRITDGALELSSVNAAPLGVTPLLELSRFAPLEVKPS